jgi:hypothetical protein
VALLSRPLESSWASTQGSGPVPFFASVPGPAVALADVSALWRACAKTKTLPEVPTSCDGGEISAEALAVVGVMLLVTRIGKTCAPPPPPDPFRTDWADVVQVEAFVPSLQVAVELHTEVDVTREGESVNWIE